MKYLFAILAALLVTATLFSGLARAQQPPVQKLTDQEVLMVQGVNTLAQVANRDCQGLDTVKAFQVQQGSVTTQLETTHAGYTFNWSTQQLVEKPKAPATK